MVSTRQMSTSLAAPNTVSSNDEIINYGGAANNLPSTSSATVGPSTAVASTSRYTSVISTRHSHNQNVFSSSSEVNVATYLTSPSGATITSPLNLLDLPIEILDKIFSYVGYKKLGQLRVISKKMNQIGGSILNSTFQKLQTQMLNRFQTVKAKMPRRESARRNHPLACECDIIETCYMRLSLLQMTFGKHIERKHCCFFPGGILDEVYNVLNYIRTTPKLERPYRVTDELFDLSTMAMEYFKERIEPNLPEIAYFNKDFFGSSSKKQPFAKTISISESCPSSSSPPQSNMVLRKGIRKIKQGMKMYNNQLTVLRSELRNCKRKSAEQGKQIAEQQKLLADQQKQTLEYANRLDENDKKNEEMSRKFSTLLQELNKCKTELQYWRSKSPAIQVCNACGHKITPAIAPDDFQALINQGVKPEDIISIDDVEDSDTSSNAALCDSDLDTSNTTPIDSVNNCTDQQNLKTLNSVADGGGGCNDDKQNRVTEKSGNVFVFPDETTTAKLLAVNTMKNLKRNYDGVLLPSNAATVASSSRTTTATLTSSATFSSNANQLNSKGKDLLSSNLSNISNKRNNINSSNLAQQQQQTINQQLQHNQKQGGNNCSSAFCSIDSNSCKINLKSANEILADNISTVTAETKTILNSGTNIKCENNGSATSSTTCGSDQNSKNISKIMNPSGFFPSSISAFNDKNTILSSNTGNNNDNTTAASAISITSNSCSVIQQTTSASVIQQANPTSIEATNSAGQENKKRRVQKNGKRKF